MEVDGGRLEWHGGGCLPGAIAAPVHGRAALAAVAVWRGEGARPMQADRRGHVLRITAMLRARRARSRSPRRRWRPRPPARCSTACSRWRRTICQLDSVSAIRDGAFDHGQPIALPVLRDRAEWPYVWTRDLSYRDRPRPVAIRSRALAQRRCGSSCPTCAWPARPQGLYAMQDTGSGGSWPISTDRVVWFLGARHLLDDKSFADDDLRALRRHAGAGSRNTPSTHASACIAARPRSSTGASRAIRRGRRTTCASSRSRLRCPPTCCTTRRCNWPPRWRQLGTTRPPPPAIAAQAAALKRSDQRALLARRSRHVHELHRRRGTPYDSLRPARHRAGDRQRRGRRRARAAIAGELSDAGPPAAR